MMMLSVGKLSFLSPGYSAIPVTLELLIGYYPYNGKTNPVSTTQKA